MDSAQIISVFGIAVPVCVTAFAWLWKTRHEKDSVRVALVAEIIALREIAGERGYVEDLMRHAKALRATPEDQRQALDYQVSVPEHYCRVYVANISKLGALKMKDASLIVMFYQYTDSVIRDVSPGGLLHGGTTDPEDFERNANILKRAFAVADELERRNPM